MGNMLDDFEMLSTKPKKFCFVLMPFSNEFQDVYEIAIKEACKNGDAYCERVDEQQFSETSIFERIVNQISQADFIIADMSHKNANVFYEVGYAHALGKSTILLTDNSGDIPFDLKHFPHLVYDRTHLNDLREKLTQKVKWFVENPVEEYKKSKVDIDLFMGQLSLGISTPYIECSIGEGFKFEEDLTIYNAGAKKIASDSYTFNIITQNMYPLYTEDYDKTLLPNGKRQFTQTTLPAIFPGSFQSFPLRFYFIPQDNLQLKEGDEEELLIRIITEYGSKEFRIILKITN